MWSKLDKRWLYVGGIAVPVILTLFAWLFLRLVYGSDSAQVLVTSICTAVPTLAIFYVISKIMHWTDAQKNRKPEIIARGPEKKAEPEDKDSLS